MITIITSPARANSTTPSLFLAGGISNCPDWQTPAGEYLKMRLEQQGVVDFNIVNPRRTGWDMSDPTASEKQIRWEHTHLAQARAVLFWFPRETLCPITLLELGKFLMQPEVQLFVGCHPEYARVFDVQLQTHLERPQVQVHASIQELLDHVVNALTDVLS